MARLEIGGMEGELDWSLDHVVADFVSSVKCSRNEFEVPWGFVMNLSWYIVIWELLRGSQSQKPPRLCIGSQEHGRSRLSCSNESTLLAKNINLSLLWSDYLFFTLSFCLIGYIYWSWFVWGGTCSKCLSLWCLSDCLGMGVEEVLSCGIWYMLNSFLYIDTIDGDNPLETLLEDWDPSNFYFK